MTQLILQPGKERSLLRRHPWLFAGAVDRLEGRARPGDTVQVLVRGGKLQFGTWQGIYLFEHRAAPHRRIVVLHLLG